MGIFLLERLFLQNKSKITYLLILGVYNTFHTTI